MVLKSGSSPAFYLADGKLNLVKIRCFSSLSQTGLEDVVKPRVLLALSNLQLRGQSMFPTPVVYAGDLTLFSINPKEGHLQESLSQLKNAIQVQFQNIQKKNYTSHPQIPHLCEIWRESMVTYLLLQFASCKSLYLLRVLFCLQHEANFHVNAEEKLSHLIKSGRSSFVSPMTVKQQTLPLSSDKKDQSKASLSFPSCWTNYYLTAAQLKFCFCFLFRLHYRNQSEARDPSLPSVKTLKQKHLQQKKTPKS